MRFASDNSGPVHPKIMDAIVRANEGWDMAYGNDDLSRSAADRVREVLEAPEAAVLLVATGTAANTLCLAAMTAPYETILCTPEAHIHEDECNGPEFYTGGAKLTLIDSEDAKMKPEALEATLHHLGNGDVHHPAPGPVSITQVTERGTLYTLDELRELTGIAKRHGVPVHLDGARFANAVAALGCTPAELSWKLGIDALSFGGTKNGCMGVEAVVFFDPEAARRLELYRKRAGHLFSKHRYLGAQMEAYLTDGLWLDMARAANDAGARLEHAIRDSGLTPAYPRGANMIYTRLSRDAHTRLRAEGATYGVGDPDAMERDGESMVRLVCDWSCPESHITRFAELLQGA